MRALVDRLCSPECAGRRSGTKEGDAARAVVVSALRDAGLDPAEQRAPCGGANVLAKIQGDVDRFVVVGAPKIEATARWLTRFVRESRVRQEPRFDDSGRADLATPGELSEVVDSLMTVSREAEIARRYVGTLRGACDAKGVLPAARRGEVAALVSMVESRLG